MSDYNLTVAFAPAIEVELDRIVYDGSMNRGHDEWFFTVRGFAASGTDTAAQMRLDDWLKSTGGKSVKAAIETDRTLGGAASDCRVVAVARVAVFKQEGGAIDLFGAEWTVRVLAAGD